MATARLSNLGYLVIGKQTVETTPVQPTIAVPLYDESLNTDGKYQDLSPAAGIKFATYATIPGQRSHTGEFTVMFEPNTAAHFINALYTQGTSTNSAGVYTYPFTLGADSASYTFDKSLGNIVTRYWGVKLSDFGIDWDDNEARAKLSVSALGSFEGREITSISGAGPYTVVLADPNGIYEGNPTKGLTVGDAIRFFDAGTSASVCDTTITAITNGTTFTFTTIITGATTAITAGDTVHLRPISPTYNIQPIPFLWTKTRFYFGATAAAAFANSTHTPLEKGSEFELIHEFDKADGAPRSGSFDPASLDRKLGNVKFTIKKLTDAPDDLTAFKNMNKSACVVRMFAGATNQYEFRLTMNALITDKPLGNLKAGDIVVSTMEMHTNYNQTDSQGFDVKVLNALTTV